MAFLVITLGMAVLYEVYAWRLDLMPVLIMNRVFMLLVCIEIGLQFWFDWQGSK